MPIDRTATQAMNRSSDPPPGRPKTGDSPQLGLSRTGGRRSSPAAPARAPGTARRPRAERAVSTSTPAPWRSASSVARVDRAAAVGAPAGHEDHARAVARADEDVLGPARAMHEVPRLQPPLLALDEQQALAREHEEVLLVVLAVVHAARLPGLQHGQRVADLREPTRRPR